MWGNTRAERERAGIGFDWERRGAAGERAEGRGRRRRAAGPDGGRESVGGWRVNLAAFTAPGGGGGGVRPCGWVARPRGVSESRGLKLATALWSDEWQMEEGSVVGWG